MSSNPNSGGGDGGIDIGSIVDRVIDRIFSRLVGGIILVGGSMGAAITSLGDAVIAATVRPLTFGVFALGTVGESLINVIDGIDSELMAIAAGTGPIGSLGLVIVYLGVAFAGVWLLIEVIGLVRMVIPFL